MKVAQLTSAHPRYDIRIFLKECVSLVRNGYDVTLLVADGNGNEIRDGVKFLDIGFRGSRAKRFLVTPWRVLRAAIALKADIYHFHDSELLFVGLALRLLGRKVIYDSHEDLPRQILSKYYIKPWLRRSVAFVMEHIEDFVIKRLSAVVTATPHIGSRFRSVQKNVAIVNNYPLMSEVNTSIKDDFKQPRQLCYIGGITRIRGIVEMVKALSGLDVKLIMAGPMESQKFHDELKATPGWENVEYIGTIGRDKVLEVMGMSQAGMLLYLPEPNHTEAQPNKMFEYMGASLPVIASDFPLWKEILIDQGAGFCVDPQNVEAIHGAIQNALRDPQLLSQMGKKGKLAVSQKFNWSAEEKVLLDLYTEILRA